MFRWEREDLVIDNTDLCLYGTTTTPNIGINTKVALSMRWLKKIDSSLILRPNLQKEFMGDQVPNVKTNTDWNELSDAEGIPVVWSV